ncbi:hypothetical protein H920_10623 [Fukomys damarensis]|uniref:Uncharacterized protein n=1 Tax=Fukomys damarensis TaxID=885580 RepID=A0A091DA32_FUKDA|nr:hypothetical protein H920_10623 [Fukomys damarensis]
MYDSELWVSALEGPKRLPENGPGKEGASELDEAKLTTSWMCWWARRHCSSHWSQAADPKGWDDCLASELSLVGGPGLLGRTQLALLGAWSLVETESSPGQLHIRSLVEGPWRSLGLAPSDGMAGAGGWKVTGPGPTLD